MNEVIALIIVNVLTIIPPTILAYATLVQGRKNEKKADNIIEKGDETGNKASNLLVKTNEIHSSTNGNLTAVRKDLELAHQDIKKLNEIVLGLVTEAKKTDNIIEKLDKLDALFNNGSR